MNVERTVNSNQLEIIKDALNVCTDDFVFTYCPAKNKLSVSERAAAEFDFPAQEFSDAGEIFKKIVYKDDFVRFQEEIACFAGDKTDSVKVEIRIKNRKNKFVPVDVRGLGILDENGEKIMVGLISPSKQNGRFDSLTNLPTEPQLKKDFFAAKKAAGVVSGFLIKFDVDNLGAVNEQFGAKVGDFVMSLVSDCIKRSAKGLSTVYKINSDEFVCANFTGGSILYAQHLYENLKRNIADTEQRIDYEVVFTISAGAVAFYKEAENCEILLRKANYALQTAKSGGKNNLKLFNAVDYARHLRELDLQEKLRSSIKNGFEGFELYYQPIVDAKKISVSEKNPAFNVIGAEALLRWSCPEYGLVYPEEFIPLLEKTGLIIPVGRWILLTGFSQCRDFNKLQKKFHLSLNLSYIQVKKSDILTDVQMALERSGVNPANITLELTEGGYMDNLQELQRLIARFQELGLKVDIDDFGTGYSNLRYLQYLKAETLKLDYSFVHKATGGDEGDRKVIKHISEMAHELKMKVCMEGVETEDDIDKLLVFEPDKFQGYYFGRPCNAVDFREHHIRPDRDLMAQK